MARITVEDCLQQLGDENRFSLIHLAVSRVKQHRNGQTMLIKGKNKEIVMTLREIAAGAVSFDNIVELRAPEPKKAPVVVSDDSVAEAQEVTEQ